ncbi:hypothetical protein KSF_089780 [Reticulibacter mediterranei]|uniref:Uncharacterized protein n=1 Tax=Reticulibacter mediterranei TaxID=2778369 RepID=A0A8J3IUW0_9CHLR|nr:hypothetical protein KSF_089780 [Reticulibacter mediterranei]
MPPLKIPFSKKFIICRDDDIPREAEIGGECSRGWELYPSWKQPIGNSLAELLYQLGMK